MTHSDFMQWKWACLVIIGLMLCGCRLPSWLPWIGSDPSPVSGYADSSEATVSNVDSSFETDEGIEEDSMPEVEAPVLSEVESREEVTTKPLDAGILPEGSAEDMQPLPAPRRMQMPVPVLPEVDPFESFAGGWVDVLVKVDQAGHVLEVKAVDASNGDLVEATLRALKQARYEMQVEEGASPAGLPALLYFDRVEF